VSPHQHEYTALLREAAVNWFRRHLAGAEPDFRTGEPDVLPPEALQVTSSGQVLQEFPAARTLFHLALELAQDRRRQTASAGPPRREPEVLRRELAGALGIAGASRAAPIYPRVIHESVVDGYAVEKVFFFSEPGVCVAGVLIHPPGGAAVRTDILLLENGTASVPEERPRIEGLLAKGSRVLVFDPRGVGAVESRSFPGRAPHDLEWRLGCDAMLLGTSTLGQRVYDVLRALDWLRAGRPDVDPAAVALHGVGSGAVWAWYAAALEPGFCALTVENMLYSAQSLVETRYYDNRRYGLKNLGYGLLPGFDFGDLLPALAPRPVRILHPLDARGEIITPEDYAARVLTEALVGILPAGWSPDVE